MKNLRKFNNIKGWITLILGGVFILTGFLQGDMMVVFRKAANICLECVGIG